VHAASKAAVFEIPGPSKIAELADIAKYASHLRSLVNEAESTISFGIAMHLAA
jgi:hypothetical protein